MGSITQTVLDTEKYEEIVNEIEKQKDLVISDTEVAKTPVSVIKNNLSVPDFVKADGEIIDMLKSLKVQIADVVQTMRDIKQNLESANTDAANSLK